MVPVSTYDSDGNIVLIGAPVAGLTNAELWAEYGEAIAGRRRTFHCGNDQRDCRTRPARLALLFQMMRHQISLTRRCRNRILYRHVGHFDGQSIATGWAAIFTRRAPASP